MKSEDAEKKPRRISAWLASRLDATLLSRPGLTLGLAFLVAAVAAWIASGITFDGSFMALLPEGDPDVTECNALTREAGGSAEMVVALAGQKRLAFARRLVERLRSRPYVRDAEVAYPVEFFIKRRLWLLPLGDLSRLRDSLRQEIAKAKARANPLYVDLEDDDEATAPTWDALDRGKAREALAALPPKVHVTADGRYLLVRVRPVGGFSDMARGATILAQVRSDIRALDPKGHGITLRLAGALPMNQEQDAQMNRDLRVAGSAALVLIMLLVTLAIRRLRALLILGLPLILGVLVTLALTRLLYGRLNLVSGFLISTLFGLGIDFGVHLYLRYLEELKRGAKLREALRQSMAETLAGCTTAAGTTAAAFFAMAISDFRGFREYGLIAGAGVIFTLAATYFVLPPLALLLDRRHPPRTQEALPRSPRRLSRGLAWVMVSTSLLALGASLYLGAAVRWRSDFDKLRGQSDIVSFSHQVEEDLGGVLAPALLWVKSIDEARRVGLFLDPLEKNASSQFRRHLSLADMLPRHAQAKQEVMRDLRHLLSQALQGDLEPADRKEVQKALALAEIPPWTLARVPKVFVRPFETRSGQGQFVMVWPRSYMATDKEVMTWAAALHRLRRDLAAQGIALRLLDENLVAARVLRTMRAQTPQVLAMAALAVILVLVLDFRRLRPVILVSGALAVGLAWTVGIMGAFDIDLNVFNQAVLPTILGMGLDNAIHIQHRYDAEGPGSISRVVATTGLAALLAAATTAIGFGTTLLSHHLGIRSMGELALAGFTSAFVACSVLLPAFLRLLERRGPKDEMRVA